MTTGDVPCIVTVVDAVLVAALELDVTACGSDTTAVDSTATGVVDGSVETGDIATGGALVCRLMNVSTWLIFSKRRS